MLKALKIIGVLLVLGVLAVVGLAFTKPDSFEVRRSTDVKASPEVVAAVLSDFHSWEKWSPFDKIDPQMKKTYSGSPTGVGSVYEWSGNSKAGAGRMEITGVSADKVSLKLDFSKPFEAHNLVDFLIEPGADKTSSKVTWSMHGPNPFVSKVMQVFVSMDKLVGKQFEDGLANLKAVAEATAAAPPVPVTPPVDTVPAAATFDAGPAAAPDAAK
jgi:hypothetical protein